MENMVVESVTANNVLDSLDANEEAVPLNFAAVLPGLPHSVAAPLLFSGGRRKRATGPNPEGASSVVDSPKRNRTIPTPPVIAIDEADGRDEVDSGDSSPFDAVLAAANMASAADGVLSTASMAASLRIRHSPRLLPSSQIKPTRTASSSNGGMVMAGNSGATVPRVRTVLRATLPSGQTSVSSEPNIVNVPPLKMEKNADRGLRHFSQRVCAKVEEKGTTTYNEVADELVQEIARENHSQPAPAQTSGAAVAGAPRYDHKNIRRRVYDALNVLMAIDVIRKDKKEIRWLGLPNETAQEMRNVQAESSAVHKRLADKKRSFLELVQRFGALKALIRRNEQNSTVASEPSDQLSLPFILINAPRDCRVHCEMLEDRSQYFFEFDAPFLINEDIELLRLMGLDQLTDDDLKGWLPGPLLQFHCSLHRTTRMVGSLSIPQDDPNLVDEHDPWTTILPNGTNVDHYLESMPPSIFANDYYGHANQLSLQTKNIDTGLHELGYHHHHPLSSPPRSRPSPRSASLRRLPPKL